MFTKRRLTTLVLSFAAILLLLVPAYCQQTQPNDLTQGLLDLLNEDKQADNLSDDKSMRAGEDPAAQAFANAIEAVQSGIAAAAQGLSAGAAGSEVMNVQAQVLSDLDKLISDLESQQSQSDPTQRNSTTKTQRSDSQDQGGKESSSQKESPSQESMPAANNSVTQSPTNQPGSEAGEAVASGVGQLADISKLQEKVWGHLPEQVRQQMQSRMVEQFLPSYREQIEAYYRALLERQ